jgi:ribosomal protein L37AE/L43A
MNAANVARTSMTGWRCSTCGAIFSSEELRAGKTKVKSVEPAVANS